MTFSNILEKLKLKNDLNNNDLQIIYDSFKNKTLNKENIKNLILLWKEKGESPFELSTLANLINQNQGRSLKYSEAIDVCGTGGDKLNTFNISTLTAIVSSSMGIKTIKHSGRSTTSVSGSVDVLNEFKINLDTEEKLKEQCFEKTNLMFTSSRHLREVFGEVKTVCKELGVPGFVNLLGPLTNPYKTSYHLLGISNPQWGALLANILKDSDKHSLIVCSKISENNFLDELSFCGINYTWEVNQNKIINREITPEETGESKTDIELLKISDKTENKLIFESTLKGNYKTNKEKECLKAVALNTGAILFLVKKAKSISSGYETALGHIQSGLSWEHFKNFISCSN